MITPPKTTLNQMLKAWRAQVRAAADQPWLFALLMRQWARLFRRFSHYYQRLLALPRPHKRALKRTLATTLAGTALLLALGQALPARAATITVDGVTCTLAEAIDSANNDNAAGNGCVDGSGADVIDLQTDVLLSAALPSITSEIVLEGNGHTIDGNDSFRVLYVQSSGNLTLNEATITDGYTSGNGGGIYNKSGSTVTVNNSTLSDNSALFGGGIFNYGTGEVTNSTFSGNSALDAGGIHNGITGIMTVNNSILTGNSANSAGGIFNWGTLTVNNSTLSYNNSAGLGGTTGGGGIRNSGTLMVNSSTLSGNSAEYGGGITNSGTLSVNNSTLSGNMANNGNMVNNQGGGIHNIGTVKVTNSTVSGNSSNVGGGIANGLLGGTVEVTNSTVSGNSSNVGGGIYNGLLGFGGTINLNRSLISGNAAGNGAEVYNNSSGTVNANNYNVVGYGGNARSFGFTPGANDLIPPGLLTTVLDTILADNGGPTFTHALVFGSVAIDAAPDAPCLAPPINGVDQRGYFRNVDGDGSPSSNECDAGSFEFASDVVPTLTPTNTPTPTPTPTPTLTPTPTSPQAHINGTDCLLADAIPAANADTPVGDCAAGNPGADTITLITDVTLSASLPAITSKITLEGNGYTLDGNNAFRVLTVSDTGDLKLNHATITGGSANSGGGIYNDGTLTVNDSTLSGNTANNGGGIYNHYEATVTINNSTLSDNSAGSGGGIQSYAFGTVVINNSTISSNSAGSGGGIYLYYFDTLVVNNSTFSENTANNGGGLYIQYGYAAINNSTLSGNTASSEGGGIYNGEFGTVNLNRSLVSGNSAPDGAEVKAYSPVYANNYNVIGYGGDPRSSGFTPGANDIVPSGALDTVLDTILADNGGSTLTHALVSGSVAIDAAPDADCLAPPINGVDQRGFPRNVDGDGVPSSNECDTGAFEFAPSGRPTQTSTPTEMSRPTRTPTPRPTRTPTPTLIPVQENVLVSPPQEQSANPLMNIVVVTLLTLGNLLLFRKWRA